MNLTELSEFVSRHFLNLWIVVLLTVGLFRTGQTRVSPFLILVIYSVIGSVVPFSFRLLMRRGKISDWHLNKREERHIYFGVVVAVMFVTTVLSYFWTNYEFFVLNLAVFGMTLLLAFFTYIYKISGHMVINVGSIFILNYLFDWKLLWLFAIVPVVAFARMYLKKHTISQIVAGLAVGLIEPYIVLKLFGLI